MSRTAAPIPPSNQRIEVDLALLNAYDRLLTARELSLVHTAKAHNAQMVYRLRSSPGVGKLLALVWRSAIQDSQRFPRVQAFVSDGRLGQGAKESAGKR